MSKDEELTAMCLAALQNPGEAQISEDGRHMSISFKPREVHSYAGRDFDKMSLEEINEFIAKQG